MDQLWGMLVPNLNVVEEPIDFYWSEWGTTLFSPEHDMADSFLPGDEMPEGRLKLAHQNGVVAKVEWIPTGNALDYAGELMQQGSSHVIMRLSETAMLHNQSSGLLPSVAFKFLRDGQPSDNIVAMPSFTGTGQWNFLRDAMKTRVERFEQGSCEDLTIRKKLTEGQEWPFSCGISRIFKNRQDGTAADDDNLVNRIPYALSFEARSPFDSMFSEDKEINAGGNQVQWYDQLKRIPSGSDLFTVNALTAPESIGGRWEPIATIRLATDLYTSQFGDERLFFEHARVNRDRIYWPTQWLRPDRQSDPRFDDEDPNDLWTRGVPAGVWPARDRAAQRQFIANTRDGGCPFQWLLDALN